MDESGARENAVPVERQVCECKASLAPWEPSIDAFVRQPHDEPTAQLNPRLTARQGSSNVVASLRQPKRAIVEMSTTERDEMSLLVNCECGRVIHGETQDEIVAKVEEHVAEDHPQLVGKLTREDIAGMTEEAGD
jgi:hypothetical protein